MTETKIYVGLNDSVTKSQKFETSRYVSLLKKVCIGNGVPFSFEVVQGGYIHEDGTYTEENSLVLSLIDADDEVVDTVARDLCVFFHQESLLITVDQVEMRYISDAL